MISVFRYVSVRQFLTDELERRMTANPSYSLRAYARDIGMSSSRVSEMLKEDSPISYKSAHIMAEKFKLDDAEKEYFLLLIQYQSAKDKKTRLTAWKNILKRRTFAVFKTYHSNFSILHKWFYVPLIEYVTAPKSLSYSVIAKKIGISEKVLLSALLELEADGYIHMTSENKWKKRELLSKYESPVGSDVIRGFHKEYLKKASVYIDSQKIEKRKYMTSVFRLRKDDLLKARQEIEIFNQNFIKKYANDRTSDLVYCLANQLYEIEEGL